MTPWAEELRKRCGTLVPAVPAGIIAIRKPEQVKDGAGSLGATSATGTPGTRGHLTAGSATSSWMENLRHRLGGVVPPVPAGIIADWKPEEETNGLGLHRASVGAGTPGTEIPCQPFQADLAPTPPDAAEPFRIRIPAGVHQADEFLRSKYDGLPLLVLDFETFYDGAGYSLDRLKSVFLYATDARFQTHGLAIRHPDGRTEFRSDVRSALDELRKDYGRRLERVAVVCHNGCFDALVLHLKFDLRPAHIIDTMLVSRLQFGVDAGHGLREVAERLQLPAKGHLEFMKGVRHPDTDQFRRLKEYALNDANITWLIASRLLPWACRFPLELWTMEHSIRLYTERPMDIDAGAVERGRDALQKEQAQVLANCGLSLAQVRSAQFGELLDADLAVSGRRAPKKRGCRGEVIYALSKKDPAFVALLHDHDPRIKALVAARLFAGSLASRNSRLEYLDRARQRGGKLHVLLGYHRAGPGRFQGGDGFNTQNIQKRGAEGENSAEAIPEAICAPPGCSLPRSDASQIEARILSWVAGQRDLHGKFAQGVDIYSEFASARFNTMVRKPRPDDAPAVALSLSRLRQLGKAAVLGLGYRMGVDRFESTLRQNKEVAPMFGNGELTTQKLAGIVYGFRASYPAIPQFWKDSEATFRDACNGHDGTCRGIRFFRSGHDVRIALPSGRELVYQGVREIPPAFKPISYVNECGQRAEFLRDTPAMVYADGQELHGGVITENIVQGIARDMLVHVIYTLERAGFPVVFHCHDSVCVCVPDDRIEAAKTKLLDAWRKVPAWAAGLVLDAEVKVGRTFADI